MSIIKEFLKKIKYKKYHLQKCGNNCHFGKNANIKNGKYVSIGNGFFCGKDFLLQAWDNYADESFKPSIIIGNNVSVMDGCQISCCNKVVVESGVLLGTNVFVADNSHGNISLEQVDVLPIRRPLYSKGGIIIKKNAWIGRNVCILPGVTIGEGAIVGANSVVTKSIPDKCVAVGAPASIIRELL